MDDIKKSMKLVESFDAASKQNKLQEMARKKIAENSDDSKEREENLRYARSRSPFADAIRKKLNPNQTDKQSVAEAEKNPLTSALGKSLYRDLSKEKKVSPAQVQRNKERWAKRQADKGQGVMEGSEEHGQNRLWQMITDYEQRAKATKNDIKKAHYLKMASELRGKLKSNDEQGVAEGVAETMPMRDAVDYLRKYGADNFKTTSNEIHFYKNGRPFSVNLIWNDDATRNVTLSSLNAARRGLTGQDVAEAAVDYDKHSFLGKMKRKEEADNKGWGQAGKVTSASTKEAARKAMRKSNRYYNLVRGDNKTEGGFPKASTKQVDKVDAEKQVNESVDPTSITLSPDALMGILKLAGMQPYTPTPTAAPVTGVVSAMPSITAVQPAQATPSLSALAAMIPDDLMVGDDCESEQGLEEADIEYANSPDEEYCDADSIMKSGNDMHRSKGTYPKVAGGDNPMQGVAEAAVPNYDEDAPATTFDQIMDFFVVNGANSDKQVIVVARKLMREFDSWARIHDRSPQGDEETEEMEAEFLQDEYPNMSDIQKHFDLVWPHQIDDSELV